MFSEPKYGWTNIDIGDYHGRGSYLTDIPFEFLYAASHALANNVPFVLYIDEEGTESYIVSYHDGTFINRITDTVETYHSDLGFKDLILDGLTDIERYIDGWAGFVSYDDTEPREKRQSLLALIGEIQLRLKQN